MIILLIAENSNKFNTILNKVNNAEIENFRFVNRKIVRVSLELCIYVSRPAPVYFTVSQTPKNKEEILDLVNCKQGIQLKGRNKDPLYCLFCILCS